MDHAYDDGQLSRLKTELAELDREWIDVDGMKMKPSQCYRFEASPAHVLFNTNCPSTLKERIETLMKKYLPHNEGSSSQ